MTEEYYEFLLANGYALIRQIGLNHWAAIYPFAFTTAIVLGEIGDRAGYADRWCYHDINAAARALLEWDGHDEPEGWHRHPPSGRRRTQGNPEEEYILP